MKYIDTHSHWSDPRLNDESRAAALKACLDQKIDFFLQGGVSPEEWLKQIEIKKKIS